MKGLLILLLLECVALLGLVVVAGVINWLDSRKVKPKREIPPDIILTKIFLPYVDKTPISDRVFPRVKSKKDKQNVKQK